MPLAHRWKATDRIEVWMWHIVEPEETLRAGLDLTPQEEAVLRAVRHPRRRREWLAVRCLAYRAMGLPTLHYDAGGAPYVSGKCISISHTDGWAAVAVSDWPVGLDIEQVSDRIEPLRDRFLTPEEQDLLPFHRPAADLTLLWTLKEATYKLSRGAVPAYKSQIRVCSVKDLRSNILFHDGPETAEAAGKSILLSDRLIVSVVWRNDQKA